MRKESSPMAAGLLAAVPLMFSTALALGTAEAEELTFVASGTVTLISPGGEYLGGRFSMPVTIGDEVRFFYTFESTAPAWQGTPSPAYLIYTREDLGAAIKLARIEVSGNVWEFVPCGAPVFCAARIIITDDYWAGGLYWDDYLVHAVDFYSGLMEDVRMHLYSASSTTPIASLASTDLPLVPPAPAAFQNRSITISSGVHTIATGDVSALTIVSPDDSPPVVSGVFAAPNPVAVSTTTELTATVDDSATGNSPIASAAFNVDGGGYSATTAGDGAFDGVTEVVTATLPGFTTAGVYDVCVRGTDAQDNTSDPTTDSDNACTLVVAYDPSGGFVTGVGWIYSAAGACQYDAVCAGATGKANFGFVSRYKKGSTIPTGNTEFQFLAGGLNFHSEAYEWLVVNMNGTNTQYKGSGTINGNLGPAGGAYQFMLWARDYGKTGTDTFRIKIWYVDAGSEVVVYDNSFQQAIGGGNIVIHAK